MDLESEIRVLNWKLNPFVRKCINGSVPGGELALVVAKGGGDVGYVFLSGTIECVARLCHSCYFGFEKNKEVF